MNIDFPKSSQIVRQDKLPPAVKPQKTLYDLFRKTVGGWIGKSLTKPTIKVSQQQFERNEAAKNCLLDQKKGEFVRIPRKNKDLDGFLIKPEIETDKYVIVCNGMRDRYENHFEALSQLSKDVGVNILTFNYRGVGSEGLAKSSQHLIDDGESVWNFLRSQGIPAENISLYGHSMGSGVATKLHQISKYKSSIVLESPFNKFSEAIKVKKGRICAAILKHFNWDFNNIDIFKDGKGDNRAIIVNRRDPTVPYRRASLYRALHERRNALGGRVKIGARREDFNPRVKTQDKYSPPAQADRYESTLAKVKVCGALRRLLHPHDRIMDRTLEKERNFEDIKVKGVKKGLEKLWVKYQKEDEEAYLATVAIFRSFLNIS